MSSGIPATGWRRTLADTAMTADDLGWTWIILAATTALAFIPKDGFGTVRWLLPLVLGALGLALVGVGLAAQHAWPVMRPR